MCVKNVLALLLVFFAEITTIQSGRILIVMPVPVHSHHENFVTFISELNQRGHDISIITPLPQIFNNLVKNVTIVDVSKEVQSIFLDIFPKTFDIWMNGDKLEKYSGTIDLSNKIYDLIFNAEQVKSILKENKFDLAIVEADIGPTTILSHFLRVPVIKIKATGFMLNFHYLGMVVHNIYYPETMSVKTYAHTFWDKCMLAIEEIRLENLHRYKKRELDDYLKEMYGPETPTMDELSKSVTMKFMSAYPVWDGNRPVSKEILFVDGINPKKTEVISEDLNRYLNESTEGVIYMCFGTTIKTEILPDGKIEVLLKALSKLPYNIVWSWNTEALPVLPKNIRVFKWVPQLQLLKHPKIKLFISHGGAHSVSEAIDAGVPTLILPIIADQIYNADRVAFFDIGKKLDWGTLHENDVVDAVNNILRDKRFRENSKKLGAILGDTPNTALESAVFWTEHIMKHGFKHYRSPAKGVSWFEYLVLDLVLCSVVLFLSLVVGVIFIVKYFTKLFKIKSKIL